MAVQQLDSIPDDTSEQIARLRAMENRYNLLTEKLLMVNENVIRSFKKLQENHSTLAKEILDLRQELQKLKEGVMHLSKGLAQAASQEQVKVLEKYVDLWKPFNFTTEEQVSKMIQESFKQRRL